MRIVILPPTEWAALVPRDEGISANRVRGSVLHYLHERHIGITPRLASELVEIANNSSGSVWGAALDRISAALKAGEGNTGRMAALWRQVPVFTLTSRLAAPLLRQACETVGLTVLFGRSALSFPAELFDATDYERYDKDLRNATTMLIESPDRMGRRFWRDAAESLFGACARSAGREVASEPFGPSAGVSDLDKVLVTFLTELNPTFSNPHRRQSLLQDRTVRSRTERSGFKPKEGGVVGVRMSRSLGDIDDILLSEYMLPTAMLAEKFLNQGFLIRHRPPMRRPRRDALIVGILAHSDRSDSDRLLKAAWLDAGFRTAILLKKAGFGKSELRWIERSGPVGYRCARVDLESLSLPVDRDTWAHDGEAVINFLRQALWVPGVLDRLASDTLVVPSDGPGRASVDTDPLTDLASWVRAAFARSWQAEFATPMAFGLLADSSALAASSETDEFDIDDFSSVHVQVMTRDPSGADRTFEPDWLKERARLSAALDLTEGEARAVDLCLVPRRHDQDAVRYWVHTGGNAGAKRFDPIGDGGRAMLERRYADLIQHFVGRALDTVVGA